MKRTKRVILWTGFTIAYWVVAVFVLLLAVMGDPPMATREDVIAAQAEKTHRRNIVIAAETVLFAGIAYAAVRSRKRR